VPEIIFGGDGIAILGLLAESQRLANDELLNTEHAQIFYALVRCYNDAPEIATTNGLIKVVDAISTKDVADEYRTSLEEEGNATRYKVTTQHVNKVLKSMGFTFRLGSGNRSYFELRTFNKAYQANLRKFGNGGSGPMKTARNKDLEDLF
jgi:hypothetical protein